MKRITRLSAVLAFLFAALTPSGAVDLCGEPDENEKLDEEPCHFLEGLPPGVIGDVDKIDNVLTLHFMVPQEKIGVEIYHNGLLVAKDMYEVKSQEKVCYDLPKNKNSKSLVLIKTDDGDMYGEKY